MIVDTDYWPDMPPLPFGIGITLPSGTVISRKEAEEMSRNRLENLFGVEAPLLAHHHTTWSSWRDINDKFLVKDVQHDS